MASDPTMPPFLVKLLLMIPLVLFPPLVWGQYARHSPLVQHVDETPNMVRLVHLSIKASVREAFLQAATHMAALSQKEAGCVAYRLYEDVSTRNTFLVSAEWTSAATWNAHRRQSYTGTYLQQLPSWLAEPATTTSYATSGRTVTTLLPTEK